MLTWSPMSARVLLVPHRLHDPLGTGIHRYAIELIRALASDESTADLDYAVSSIDEPDMAVGPPVVHIGGPRRLLHLRWATLGRPPIERLVGDTALVHMLTPAVPVATSAPLVVTVHDLLPLRFPSWYPVRQRWLFRRALRQTVSDAVRVIVPSSAVAADISDATDIDRSRITVIPEGVDSTFRRPVSDGDRLERVASPTSPAREGTNEVATLVAALNAHADKLNARLFSSMDYAVIARR